MLPENFAIIGALIASTGGFYYLYETITGKSQPNRVTWSLWALFPMITFFAQRSQNVGAVSWVTFVSGFTPILVVTASFFNKKAYWKAKPLDYVCMLAGFIGLGLWAITKDANLAIAFSIIADLFAAAPTVIKCYKHPKSESWIAYGLSTIGFSFSLLTIHSWTFQNYAFVVYLVFINATMSILSSRQVSKLEQS